MRSYKLLDSEREFSLALIRSMEAAIRNEFVMQEMGKVVNSAFKDSNTIGNYKTFITSTVYYAYQVFSTICPDNGIKLHSDICKRLDNGEESLVVVNLIRCAMFYHMGRNRQDGFYTDGYVEYYKRVSEMYSEDLVFFTDFTLAEVLMYNIQRLMYRTLGGKEDEIAKTQEMRLNGKSQPFDVSLAPKSDIYFELIKIMSKEMPADAWRRIRSVWAWTAREGSASFEDLMCNLPVISRLESDMIWQFISSGSERLLNSLETEDILLFFFVYNECIEHITVKSLESFYSYALEIDITDKSSSDLVGDLITILGLVVGVDIVTDAVSKAVKTESIDDSVLSNKSITDMLDLGSYLVPVDLTKYKSIWEIFDIDYNLVVITALSQLSV